MATTVINLRNGKVKDAIYIGRPSLFGNPFVIGIDGTRQEVIEKYLDYFLDKWNTNPQFKREVQALKGKTLACFCAPEACHGDIIAHWLDNDVTPDA